MESGLRPAGCRPPLTSLFRQILRTLGAQNRREDTNLAKAGFLILALHGTVGLFFTFRDSESAGSGKPNMEKRLVKISGTAFFFRERSIFALRMTGKAAAMTKAVQEAGGERTIGMGQRQQKNSGRTTKNAPV